MISRNFTAACAAMFLLVIAIVITTTSPARAAPLYTVSFLPTGFDGVQLNNAGQVVGTAGGAAALYSGGVLTTLAPAASMGAGINNHGDTTGSLGTFYFAEAFTHIGGTFANIDGDVAGPGIETYGVAINDNRVVGGNIFEGGEHTRGFLYQNGVVDEIGTFGGDFSPLTAINNHGAATGYAAYPGPAGGEYFHAYLYQDGTLQDLGTLGAVDSDSWGTDINDLGQVVGFSGSRPFLYSGGSMIDLGTLGGPGGYAYALNDAGVIVGSSYASLTPGALQHAFVYDDGVMADLNLLVDGLGGWELTIGEDINAAGQILGTACQNDSCTSVLLTPVPEPAAGLLLLAGLGALMAAASAQRRAQGGNLLQAGLAARA